MFKADNSLHVFVGPNSTVADVSFQNDVTVTASAGSGSICVVHDDGTAPNGPLVTGDFFKVAQKHADGSVSFSPLVKFDDCTFNGGNQAARVQQTTTLDLCDDTPNTRYTLRLNFKHNVALFSNQSDQYFFEYNTGDVVTAGEVMANFVLQVNLAGGTKDKVVAAAVGTDGMTILGLAQTWSLGLHTDTMVLFDATITGFVAAATNVVTGAARGSGVGRAVAELEWFGKGSMGAPYRSGTPNNADYMTYYAVSTANYDTVECDCKMSDPNHAVAGSGVSRVKIIVALPDDIHQTDGAEANDVFTVAAGSSGIFNAA